MLSLQSKPATPKSVLIIDDDPVVTGVYEAYFIDAGYKVAVAHDGAEGLQVLRFMKPDAVLLDLSMPNMNGIDWLKQARSDPQLKNLPVVVLTAGKIGWQVKAAGNAVNKVLPKATEPVQVVRAVVSEMSFGAWSIN